MLCKFIFLLAHKEAEAQRFIKTFKHPEYPSPDSSGYPFAAAFGQFASLGCSVEQVDDSSKKDKKKGQTLKVYP